MRAKAIAFCVVLAASAQAAKIEWFGHAYFLLEDSKGTRIAVDPYDKELGYKIPDVEADAVLVTHEHFDHNAVSNVKGRKGAPVAAFQEKRGEFSIGEIKVIGFQAYHDEESGHLRGEVTMYLIELDGLRVLHCGDLGHVLSKAQCDAIGRVDVLLIPTSGLVTIPLGKIDKVIESLKPRIVIPMHYKTPALTYRGLAKFAPVERFAEGRKNTKRVGKNTIEIKPGQLPEKTEIWILDYE